MSPIDASYRIKQQVQEIMLNYRRYRTYSCTTGGTANAAVSNLGTGT